jgi:hypothetical protein
MNRPRRDARANKPLARPKRRPDDAPVPHPPPLPQSATAEAEAASLLAELQALETPDLLALCLRFGRSPQRLGLYLTLFRARAGARAQFAACLVCFDLARQGSATAQREFLVLAPTMTALAEDAAMVAGLLGGDPYLAEVWAACREAIAADDPRQVWGAPEGEEEIVGESELLDEDEIDLDLEPEPPASAPGEDARTLAQRQRFAADLEKHLGHDWAHGDIDWGRGFRTGSGAEVDRLERFLGSMEPLRGVPAAAGLASLGRLFLAAQLRRTTLFGRPNARRQSNLRAGLRALPISTEAAARGAAIFEFEGEKVVESFQKVLELLLDFLAFCVAERLDPLGSVAVERYVALNRAPPPALARQRRRRV